MDVVDELLDDNTNDISNVSDLARKMHQIEPRQSFESWRRNLRKWRKVNAREEHIALIARAFGISRNRLPAAIRTARTVGDVERRLESLAADLAEAVREQAQANGRIQRLQARVRTLEARPLPAEDPPKDQAGP